MELFHKHSPIGEPLKIPIVNQFGKYEDIEVFLVMRLVVADAKAREHLL